ncbi:hypothetical protein [Salmonella enterica]|uniref:hypothetical protein n=1 Tax=Salmonella enterica TaxID=28901 RepID=UPI00398C812B
MLFPASSVGKNCSPRFAAKMDVSQMSDITGVIDHHTFQRHISSDKAVAKVHSGV